MVEHPWIRSYPTGVRWDAPRAARRCRSRCNSASFLKDKLGKLSKKELYEEEERKRKGLPS